MACIRASGVFDCFVASRWPISDQVTSQLLLSLDSLKERLEVTSTKAVKVVALDDFDEDSRAVQHMLSIKSQFLAYSQNHRLHSL